MGELSQSEECRYPDVGPDSALWGSTRRAVLEGKAGPVTVHGGRVIYMSSAVGSGWVMLQRQDGSTVEVRGTMESVGDALGWPRATNRV